MSDSITATMGALAVLGLGLSAGALLTEGAVLVPFWRSLPPEEFLRWYKRHAGLLFKFFGPIEVVPTLLVLAAAVSSAMQGGASTSLSLSALFALLVVAMFPLYFRSANESFATGSIESANVADELRRWSAWHWARTVLGVLAFAFATVHLHGAAA